MTAKEETITTIDPANTDYGCVVKRKGNKITSIKTFADDIDVVSKYKVGSRMWAFEMLDTGKKIKQDIWVGKDYIYLDSEGELYNADGEFWEGIILPKDGWELYKESPKKTKILKDAIIDQETFMWKNKVTSPNEYWRISHEEFYNNLYLEVELINKD